MANEFKRHVMSLFIREMKIKAPLKHHPIHMKMNKIKKTENMKVCKDTEQGSANFLFKGPDSKYFNLVGHMVFVTIS